MLAHDASYGENAVATLLTGTGRLAHLGDRARTRLHGLGHLTVADDGAVAEDHGRLQVSGSNR
jgi:hypothetical protein